MLKPAKHAPPEAAQVLTKAVLRAASLLEINQAKLAQILGLSAASVSRMASGGYALDDSKKEWELGALFVRLFRSLDTLIGSNDMSARAWLQSQNRALGGRPIEMIMTTEGLVHAVQYLDASRGRL